MLSHTKIAIALSFLLGNTLNQSILSCNAVRTGLRRLDAEDVVGPGKKDVESVVEDEKVAPKDEKIKDDKTVVEIETPSKEVEKGKIEMEKDLRDELIAESAEDEEQTEELVKKGGEVVVTDSPDEDIVETEEAVVVVTKKPTSHCEEGEEELEPYIMCGRGLGRSDCPEDSHCSISDVDSYATCCAVKQKPTPPLELADENSTEITLPYLIKENTTNVTETFDENSTEANSTEALNEKYGSDVDGVLSGAHTVPIMFSSVVSFFIIVYLN